MSECIKCYLRMDKSNAYFECKLRKKCVVGGGCTENGTHVIVKKRKSERISNGTKQQKNMFDVRQKI